MSTRARRRFTRQMVMMTMISLIVSSSIALRDPLLGLVAGGAMIGSVLAVYLLSRGEVS
ncbi:MAG: hypothetical protein QXP81_08605 [Nitrososphaerota archaeon]